MSIRKYAFSIFTQYQYFIVVTDFYTYFVSYKMNKIFILENT